MPKTKKMFGTVRSEKTLKHKPERGNTKRLFKKQKEEGQDPLKAKEEEFAGLGKRKTESLWS